MSTRSAVRGRLLSRGGDDLAATVEADAAASSPAFAVAAFFVGWVVVGLALAWLLVRRGHDPLVIAALGVGLGPLLVVLIADPGDGTRVRSRLVRGGSARDGDVDVLIVLDGDPSALRELDPTLQCLHDDLRRTTIVTTVPHECIEPDPMNRALPAATARLLAAAEHIGPLEPELVVLAGHPRHVPLRFAEAERYALTLHAVR